MDILEIAVNDLIPYENNPRNNEMAVDAVAASIKEFGFKQPIVIDANNVIVCGHTRLLAAKKIGIQSVPCVMADDLTDDQIKAYRLADNKVSELAGWNAELLSLEMASVQNVDMTAFGFEMPHDELMQNETSEDDYNEEPPAEPNAKLGDIYQLGEHRLMCGSSTNPDDIKFLMDGQCAKILFTSPPYSDLREYEGGKDLSVSNVSDFICAYKAYINYQCVNLGIIRKDQEIIPYWDEYTEKAHSAGYKMLAWNVWDKTMCGSIGQQSAFFPIRHEWIFVFGTDAYQINKTWKKRDESIRKRQGSRLVRQKDGSTKRSSRGDDSSPLKKMESVVTVCSETGKIRSEHPATFPVALPAEYINAMTSDGDIVIEPFCGSGTTLIACEQLHRKCYGMELEPKYVDVIISRWERFTGKKAVKLN